MRSLYVLFANTAALKPPFPKAMVITVVGSVGVVILLAGFVLYMWISQQKSGAMSKEINRLTASIDAGFVNFFTYDRGVITYASQGFYNIMGMTKEEIKDVYEKSFYRLIGEENEHFFRELSHNKNESIDTELKIKTGNGIRWFRFTGKLVVRKGLPTISAALVDITLAKEYAEKLALEQERYRLATELSNDVIMTYSLVNDTLKLGENFKEYYGGETTIEGFFANKMWEKGNVYSEDYETIAEMMRIIMHKDGNLDHQIRIKDKSGDYIWNRIIGVPIADNSGSNKEFVGKMMNIDSQKKQIGVLEMKAMKDPLTGAFNKEFTKSRINEYIVNNPENPGMLLLVDIDHFKNINDTYGHIMGDNIIIEVVHQVTKAFRSNDIIGRIGGDEFVVFVCNVRNPEDQIKQAKKLHEVLRQPVTIDGKVINKSASIGIALFPDHASSYERLVECADEALYKVKDNGRDSFIIYGNE